MSGSGWLRHGAGARSISRCSRRCWFHSPSLSRRRRLGFNLRRRLGGSCQHIVTAVYNGKLSLQLRSCSEMITAKIRHDCVKSLPTDTSSSSSSSSFIIGMLNRCTKTRQRRKTDSIGSSGSRIFTIRSQKNKIRTCLLKRFKNYTPVALAIKDKRAVT